MISTMIEIIEVEYHFVVVSITSVKWAIPFNICTPPPLSRTCTSAVLPLRNSSLIICLPWGIAVRLYAHPEEFQPYKYACPEEFQSDCMSMLRNSSLTICLSWGIPVQLYVYPEELQLDNIIPLLWGIPVRYRAYPEDFQRRSDKQLASCHVSSRPMRSLYFPSCFLQNLGRKICIRRKINREKTLILKFSCKISSVVVLLQKIRWYLQKSLR
jgi:hypothetical protein